ncbi:MAG: type II toxin-antitoxin system RelE/ParE family toxin [Thiotrichaceae bacterium]
MEYQIETTAVFDKWFKKLKDRKVKQRINSRFLFLEQGHFGDHESLGETEGIELFELRFFFGAGYRIYYILRDNQIILLMNGGDKASQSKDIDKARKLLTDLE